MFNSNLEQNAKAKNLYIKGLVINSVHCGCEISAKDANDLGDEFLRLVERKRYVSEFCYALGSAEFRKVKRFSLALI